MEDFLTGCLGITAATGIVAGIVSLQAWIFQLGWNVVAGLFEFSRIGFWEAMVVSMALGMLFSITVKARKD